MEETQDIREILAEEVKEEIHDKNTVVDENDFGDPDEDPEKDPEADPETEEEEEDPDAEDPEQEEEEEQEQEEEKPKGQKQKAAAGIIKKRSGMAFTMYNFAAKRAGKMLCPTKPDHFKITGEDKEDLQDMLECTAEEENWQGVKSKWFLIAGFVLLIAERVMTMNKKELPPVNQAQQLNTGTEQTINNKQLDQMQKMIETLQEQNNLYKQMLDMRTDNAKTSEGNIKDMADQKRFYKGYDLSKISFTRNGAIKDPSKAGEKGYTNEGVKTGAVSKDVEDIKQHWKLYREFVLKHNIDIEEAQEIY